MRNVSQGLVDRACDAQGAWSAMLFISSVSEEPSNVRKAFRLPYPSSIAGGDFIYLVVEVDRFWPRSLFGKRPRSPNKEKVGGLGKQHS